MNREKQYQLLYRGVLVMSTNVRSKAETTGWRLVKEKNWDIKELQVRDMLAVAQ